MSDDALLFPGSRSVVGRGLAFGLRLFYRLLYNEMAWSYDLVAGLVSLRQWESWVYSTLPYLHGPRLLELGHGPGHLQVALQEQGFSVIGLDVSRQMGRQAQRRLTRRGLKARLVRAQAQHLPFANNSFEQVVATFPSEYILSAQTLAEVWRVLVDGGEAIVAPLAWITGLRPLERAAAWLFRVTDESPEWDERWLAPVRQTGFQATAEWVTLKASRVVIIRAVKAPLLTRTPRNAQSANSVSPCFLCRGPLG